MLPSPIPVGAAAAVAGIAEPTVLQAYLTAFRGNLARVVPDWKRSSP
jgi:hypothetical protein